MPLIVPTEYHFAQKKDMIDALSQRMFDDLMQLQGQACSIVLAGGTTPKDLYLSFANKQLGWPELVLVMSDERWVPVDDVQSNEKMVREAWLNHVDHPPTFCSLMSEAPIEQAIPELNQRIQAIDKPFRWVLLGMGLDGHTASLFPDAPEIHQALSTQADCAVLHPGSQSVPRVSLTPQRLLESERIILILSGEDKYRVFQQSVTGQADTSICPVQFLWQQYRVPVDVYVCC